eukprot:1139568-Pelagomonas_calceolata.AAC.5
MVCNHAFLCQACTEGLLKVCGPTLSLWQLHDRARVSPTQEVATDNFWEAYLGSTVWQNEYQLQLELSEGQPFQIKADSAVAASLCAFLHHGLVSQGQARPENAVIAAVHYGGDTDTVAAMTGGGELMHVLLQIAPALFLEGGMHGGSSIPAQTSWMLMGHANGVRDPEQTGCRFV